jgi:CBS domain containing-hemolysin-like protein
MTFVNLTLVVILIAATSFFVAAEFAIVKVRDSRVEQLIQEGNKKALAVRKVIHNLDGYLSACQLGITITALATLGGWFLDKSHKRPELGQSVVHQNLRFTITEYEKNTIQRLQTNFLKKENSG